MLLRDGLPSPLLCVIAAATFVLLVAGEVAYNRLGHARVHRFAVATLARLDAPRVRAILAGLGVLLISLLLNKVQGTGG